jgi:uncharacterized membrane protein
VTLVLFSSVILREEDRLRILENGMFRKILGSERKATGSWIKLRNKELHNLYSSANVMRVMTARNMDGNMRNAYKIVVGNTV